MARSIAPFSRPGGWLSLGLKPLDPGEWIVIDDDFVQQVRLKAQILSDRREQVSASLPGSTAAQQELLEKVIANLLQHHPQQFWQQGDALHSRLTGETWTMSDFAQHPLGLAGRLVQEDWCVLLPRQEAYVLVAGSVCFPFRWRLQDKLGRSLSGIHDPVPGYGEKLSRPVDSVFDRLRADYSSVRYNWGIVDTPDLCLLASHSETPTDPTITIENAGDRLWLRLERQTLCRLPHTGGIAFGIHTTVEPLSKIKAKAEAAFHLAEAIEQLPEAAHVYKSLLPLRAVLSGYLRGELPPVSKEYQDGASR